MKAQLLPVYLDNPDAASFTNQLAQLQRLTGDLAEWLPPAPLGSPVPEGADAVVVPDMTGTAYRMLEGFTSLAIPIVIVTSEFGTVSMWDWEIRDFLSRRGVPTIAPTSLDEYRDVIRSLGAKRTVAGATMLAYQDDLGGGKQPDIFKRFYWWEDECVADLERQFGITVAAAQLPGTGAPSRRRARLAGRRHGSPARPERSDGRTGQRGQGQRPSPVSRAQ